MTTRDLPLGHTEPRIFTPPLRELTPATSYGFDVIDFARDVLGEPLDPWQAWAAIHLGELLENGNPRFHTLLILVARQQGKTHLLRVLNLYWLFVERRKMILGMSTNLDYAKEAWQTTVEVAEANENLAPYVAKVRLANGEQNLQTVDGCRYKIAASNRKGGRSLTVHRLVIDELREHRDWTAYNAAAPATNAVPGAQIFCISNMGDDGSVVLNALRDAALSYIRTGEGDAGLALLEWSAPEESDITDPDAIAAANPNVGRPNRTEWRVLLGQAKRAKAAGGEEEIGFKTEILCMRVPALDAAVDAGKWDESADANQTLDAHRSRVALCLDISPDELHATLVSAVNDEEAGVVRIEVVDAWSGAYATRDMRQALPGLVQRVKPKVVGWLPGGPAAAQAQFLRNARLGAPVQEIKADVPAVCMGLADLVKSGEVRHPGDPLLDMQVKGSEKLRINDRWVFSRKGGGHCDAAYATAGAVHLARQVQGPRGPLEFLMAE